MKVWRFPRDAPIRQNAFVLYRFGEFELNPATFELRRGVQPIALEPQVFGVLAYLVANRDRVVTKDEILQSVWGHAFVSEAALSSRIMAARRALGDSGKEQRWIKTVHGKGFRFVGAVEEVAGEPPTGSEGARRLLDEAADALARVQVSLAEERLDALTQSLDALGDRERAEWHVLRAQCAIHREGWASEDAVSDYEEAIRLAEGVGAVDVFRSARYHLATLHELRAEYAQSEVLMRAAVMDAPDEASDAEARELLACSLFHQGRFVESAEHAGRGAAAEEPPGAWRLSAFYGEDPRVSCHYWLALSLWFTGREDEALRHASRALRRSEEPGRIYCLAHSRQQAAMLHQLRRDLPLCEHWAKATVAIGARQGMAYREAAGRVLLGWACVLQGADGEESAAMEESLARINGLCAQMEAPYFEALLAEAEMALGQAAGAAARLDRLLESEPVRRGFFFTAEILRLRALAERKRRGSRKRAQEFLERALDVAAAQGALALEERCRAEMATLS